MEREPDFLIVSIAKLDDIVIKTIEQKSGMKCVELYKYAHPTRLTNFQRHKDCLSIAYKAFLLRKRYSNIIFWQQFIGLYYNLWCYFLFARKVPKSIILTVIYIKRHGMLGKIYHLLYKISFLSKLHSKLVCHSSSERNYYLIEFGQQLENEIIFCKLGEGMSLQKREPQPSEKYFFSGGSSNRDYETLISAFDGLAEKLIIACKPENIGALKIPKNVTILHNAYGDDFLNLINNAYSVILTISDPNVSSGQLVLLNAMRFGKSTIVTGGNCMSDYIEKEYAYEVPARDVEKLRESIILLSNNPQVNNSMSANAYKYYCDNYSIDKYAERISDILSQAG